MKTLQTLLLLLAVVVYSPMAMAQVDIMDALKQNAEMNNEAHGENSDGNSEELTPQQEEWQRQWEAEWRAQQDAEILQAMNTKYLKCTALMVLYVHAYLKLVNEHKIGDLTMSACDAYGMQTLALASSTFIMYCPEEMAQLSDEELTEIFIDFKNIVDEYNVVETDDFLDEYVVERAPIGEKLDDIWRFYLTRRLHVDMGPDRYEELYVEVMKYLIEFFKPRYIIPQTLKIAQEMEDMGCSG